ncbi:MAG: protein kinase, partial [Pirellulales bacterium]
MNFVERAGYCDVMVWIVERLCRGLAHAHLRGIIHRDLKPANVLLTDDGQPMLLDFNLATHRQPAGRQASLVGGTLPYMAPEQIESLRAGSIVDERSDVFSMGVILFELLTRKHPFPIRPGSIETVSAEMVADRRIGPTSARSIEPRVSPGLDAIIRRCLDPDPHSRYRSAVELQEDLERHLDHLPLRHVADYSPRERLTKWIRRHPRLASASTVIAVSALLLFTLVFYSVAQRRAIARLEATDQARQFEATVALLRAPLTSPDIATASLRENVAEGLELLANLHVDTAAGLEHSRPLELLDAETRQAFRGRLRELGFMLANAMRRQAERAGDRGERDACLTEAIRLNRLAQDVLPGENPPRGLLLQRADLVEARGEKSQAEAVRKRARHIPIRTTMDRYLLALDEMTGRRYARALPLLEEVRRQTPRDFSIWLLTGSCLMGLERLEEAEGCYTTCVALRDESPWGHFQRGRCRLALNRFPAAEDDFSRVIALKSVASRATITRAFFNRGIARQRQGRLQEAVDDLTQAIDLGATENRIYFARARLFDRLGQRRRAEEDRRQGLTLMPSDEKSWIARGMARLRHDPQAALDDFRHALRLNPRSAAALRNVAHVLAERLHDDQQALAVLDDLAAVAPEDSTVIAGQGVLAARIGHRDGGAGAAGKG